MINLFWPFHYPESKKVWTHESVRYQIPYITKDRTAHDEKMIGVEISHTYFVINFKYFVLAQSNVLV